MGAKLGLSLWGRNIDWGFLRTGCWGYLDLKGRKTDRGENCLMMNFTARILHRILLGWLNQGGWGGLDIVARMGEGRGVHRVLVGRPECKRPLGRPRCRWEYNIKLDLREIGRTGFSWLRIESNGGLLWTWWWTFGFRKESRILFDKLSDNQLFK
jgi:hypothetical protein